MPVDMPAALAALDFGRVDAESEADLDQRFVRTDDFEAFATDEIWIALGPKGTGKSALFELFAKHEPVVRQLSPGTLDDDVVIATGTGFGDLSQLATGDIERLKGEDGYDHDRLWRLYIAVRAGLGASKAGLKPGRGPLQDLLRALAKLHPRLTKRLEADGTLNSDEKRATAMLAAVEKEKGRFAQALTQVATRSRPPVTRSPCRVTSSRHGSSSAPSLGRPAPPPASQRRNSPRPPLAWRSRTPRPAP